MPTQKKDLDIALATENIKNLEKNDIILASYLGSGSSLIGGILIELGLDYIEGYQEKISPKKQQTEVVLPLWRKHWKQLDTKYNTDSLKELRFFKTHFYPESYVNAKPNTAVLLIRDARDAVISYYNWRKGFSDETGTLSDFLNTYGYYGKKPFNDWASYIEEWLRWGNEPNHKLYLIKYEDLKFNPEKTIKKLLKFFNIKRTKEQISRAVENSRFSKIKNEEIKFLKNKNQPRIFRKGLVGEWRTTLSSKDLNLIEPQTSKLLKKYHYIETNPKKFQAFNHWFIGYNASTEKHIRNILEKGEKAALITLEQKCPINTQNPNFLLIKSAFQPRFLDFISGTIYVSSSNEEILKAVENIAQINGSKLRYI